MTAAFTLSPLVPYSYIILLAVAAALVLALAVWKKASGFYVRGAFFILLASLLLNPVILQEARKGLADKLVIVMDDSESQAIGGRDKTAEKVLEQLQREIAGIPGVEPLVIHAPPGDGTRLFAALQDNLAGIPLSQVAGTVFVTDGQVHDVPKEAGVFEKLFPLHAVLTGEKNEFDRKVTIVSAPQYGMLDEDVNIAVKVEDFGRNPSTVTLGILRDGEKTGEYSMMPGEVRNFSFTLSHPGQNVFEFSVPPSSGELTESNNKAPVIVNAVRDRLRVLLVSGSPHMGERAWRNLLKSDPAIDLIHFTILRSPATMDMTPTRDLSLIVFPVEELFEQKINDFDLIIFDKYKQYGLLPPQYLDNIARFVRNGGAFLMAMGSDKLEQSLFGTALADVLPVEPLPEEQSILKGPFRPELTGEGEKHPVTADLAADFGGKEWGRWFTQVDVSRTKGKLLMTGSKASPLLVLDEVEGGRVAVLASDNIWLWSKGIDKGGPATELLRNTAHWLMKEPELEAGFIKASVKGNVISVAKRGEPGTLAMTMPSGEREDVTLEKQEKGWSGAKVIAGQTGIYSFSADGNKAFVVVGTAENKEFSDVHTTDEHLKDMVDKSGGEIVWYSEDPGFSLKSIEAGARRFGGSGWLGVKRNGSYTVESVEGRALLSPALMLLLLLGGLLYAWRRESR